MKPIKWMAALALAGGMFCAGSPATAQTLDPTSGHYYQFVSASNIPWMTAKTEAESLTHLGIQGHLATITSAQEQLFIQTNLPAAPSANAWLGGYQDTGAPDYSEPAGGWRWVTGEAWSYTNWNPAEPNNNGPENFLQFLGPGWNDFSNIPVGHGSGGYLVEFDTPPGSAVPEPASVLLFLPALGVMGFLRRRRGA